MGGGVGIGFLGVRRLGFAGISACTIFSLGKVFKMLWR